MNRFKTRRKPKDEVAGRSLSEEQSSMPSFRGFGRKKKVQEELPKPEIDLTNALPSSDDFRTSLLMTGLSARFSMLKEQDDPNSKIGKASDDSVLFPKRQSRLMDMGYGVGLADIAEVESIRAPFSRLDSYASDDGDSVKASIMDRGKPNEGNNLFGGRQKIYRIPAGASSSKSVGGMGGRALYEDDVAQSAFQKWRQTERGRKSFEAEDKDDVVHQTSDFDAYRNRSESPLPVGYDRKRETNSTTSSTPSHPRNSTAATSVVSQPAASLKDWQHSSTTSPSVASTPAPERGVTRTRRLYEQSLSQEMHEQQSSALSRIDTLSGRRGLASRTPDLSQKSHSPSPTNNAFAEKFATDRRPILAKASAPNLRSISPPTTGSSMGTIDFGVKVPSLAETRSNFVGSPPLSPPVSETGSDHPTLNIQPNDWGKATSLGLFEKPIGTHDESKFVQRQLQLQQGRSTPTSRIRAESTSSFATGRSRSSSRPPATRNTHDLTVKTGIPDSSATFLDDVDDKEDDNDDISSTIRNEPRRPNLPLPASEEDVHPALRQTAPSMSRSTSVHSGEAPSALLRKDTATLKTSAPLHSPHDSPTLGPTTTGLSGIVRQHLRTHSDASSIYGGVSQSGDLDSRFSTNISDAQMVQDLGMKSNPWSDQDWSLHKRDQEDSDNVRNGATTILNSTSLNSSERDSQELEDDFASQLADARRRVTERLTSYVESDTSRPPSPVLGATEPQPPLPVPSRPNPLGILRGKSSRGSLIDRSRDVSNSKTMRMLGLGSVTMSTSPLPSKETFEEGLLDTTREEEEPPETNQSVPEPVPEPESDAKFTKSKEENQPVHPGLRAFRQARRELQKRKELETLARHQQQQQDASQNSPPRRERNQSLEPSAEVQRVPDEGARSVPGADPHTDRDRSGSESSDGPRGQIRPPRLRNGGQMDSVRENDGQLGPATSPRPAQLRSPGLPGTDIRRSPIMPPQAFGQGAASPGRLNVRPINGILESRSGQPSPISPLGSNLPSPNMNIAPNDAFASTERPRRPSVAQNGSSGSSTTTSTLDESMKRVVKKRDISEPTFVMSTSRVPTVTLPQRSSPESNRNKSARGLAGSSAGYVAPPLPPINPARKREPSKTRGLLHNFMGRNGETEDAPAGPTQFSSAPYESVGFSAFSQGRNNKQPVVGGPPASRTVMHPATRGRPGVGVTNGGMI